MVYKGLKYGLKNIADEDIQKCFNVANNYASFWKKYWFIGTMLDWFDP